MTVSNICPECCKVFYKKISRCNCGWILTAEIDTSIRKYQCHGQKYGKRCEEEGTVCKSTRGNNWFCSEHAY